MAKALIVGGGIAGTVAAMALHKAGVDAVVYEAYPTGADDVGAFLSIMNNGVDALRAIEADQAVVDNSFPAERIEFFSGTGKRLGDVDIGHSEVEGRGPRTLTRARLYRVLQDEARARGIPVEHGKRLTTATSAEGGVRATFADGSAAEADFLVGADGIHSVARTLIDKAAPEPRYVGTNTVCGYAPASPLTTAPGTYRMVYGKRAFLGYTTAPRGETWWFASVPGPELPRAELAKGTEEWRRRALSAFAGDKAETAPLFEASDRIVASNAYDLAPLRTWSTCSAIVIGDAAHAASPNAGHGAAMAIEDAVTLGECVRDLGEPKRAFAEYERLRRERVERLVATSAKMARRATPGPVGRVVRDLTASLASPHTNYAFVGRDAWFVSTELGGGSAELGCGSAELGCGSAELGCGSAELGGGSAELGGGKARLAG